MNRHQNHLELLLANSTTGKTTLLLQEDNKYYIDIHDNLTFLSDNTFIWSSESDGFNHLYLYGMDGKLKKQVTSGSWEVSNFYGVDEKNKTVFFQAAAKSPLEKEVYSISLKDGKKKTLTPVAGINSAQFSTTYNHYVWNHSTINSAPTYSVYDRSGKLIRVLEDNASVAKSQTEYKVQPVEFFKFSTSEQVELNGYKILPNNFDPAKKYPVFMFLYGGPGSQKVLDSWIGSDYWWFQSLAQQGYIIACIDNRGTGGRGEEFKKMTYLQLGHYETIDQIEAAQYLGRLPYADSTRIGIFGWSYGGYMSSLCLLKGNDVFNSAIAVAPVTNWKWYDNIYTERYMRDLKENSKGYEENSPVNFADRLTGNYLLVHGSSDDNVHFQHAAEMSAALIKANKQYDTYFYPNRNHGIHGDNARRHLYIKMTSFINEHLRPENPTIFSNQPSKS
jgi:dipeptidyl-peptidase-4